MIKIVPPGISQDTNPIVSFSSKVAVQLNKYPNNSTGILTALPTVFRRLSVKKD